jgi:hypothetical protein
MNSIRYILFSVIWLLSGSCVTQFIPETDERQEILVVEGLITDQPGINTVKLTKSRPLADKRPAYPYRGCTLTITDDLENIYSLTEIAAGIYVTDSSQFQGIQGRKYKLVIRTNDQFPVNYSYESLPMEMKPVPPIDSLFYEKITIKETEKLEPIEQGCQIYLNTYDPAGICKYYRWDYIETWKFQLPYSVLNSVCWVTNKSGTINIKKASVMAQERITRYPLNFISNLTDRLNVKYSIMVNQYSLNEDEYIYWERLQNISEEVGSLYDITPASIPGNIFCTTDANEKVLGYFSVSARSTKRFFIEDYFRGQVDIYSKCPSDTIYGEEPVIQGLNNSVWIIRQDMHAQPAYTILTVTKGCADCTVRGTTVKPSWWEDDK